MTSFSFSTPSLSHSLLAASVAFCISSSALALVVLGDLGVLLQLLELLHRVAADGAAAQPWPPRPSCLHLLNQILAALLVQLGHDQAHYLAVVGGVEAQVALLNGLFDGRRSSCFPTGAMTSIRGSGAGDVAQLIQREWAFRSSPPVICDPVSGDWRGRRAAWSDPF